MAALLDNFNRANETPLSNGGAWKGPIFSGDAQLLLNGNRVSAAGSSVWADSYWATKFPSNQIVGYEIAAKVSSRIFEMSVRIQNPGTSNLNLYYCAINTSTGAWELGSVVKGVEATVGTGSKALTVGDKVYLEASGTTIRCIHETAAGVKTTVIEKTSSAVSGEGFIGASLLSNGTELAIDNFYGGALEEGGGKAWKLELSDTVTGTDALVKASAKVVSDAASGSDAIVKAVVKSLADSATAADALSKRPSKSLGESIAGTDALSKQPGKSLADTVTGSDGIGKGVSKALADVVAAADALAKKQMKALIDSVTGSDSVVARIVERLLPKVDRPTDLVLAPHERSLSLATRDPGTVILAVRPTKTLVLASHGRSLALAPRDPGVVSLAGRPGRSLVLDSEVKEVVIDG